MENKSVPLDLKAPYGLPAVWDESVHDFQSLNVRTSRERDAHPLEDAFGRRMRKLRVSLLDTCNLRCRYCMPESPRFMEESRRLSAEEFVRIARILVQEGIEEIRLTGGEPTLHPGLVEVARGLSDIGLKKLGLTSNGVRLERFLPDLASTQCRHLNISLDSLKRDRFAFLARRDGLKATLSSIDKALELGFHVKINVVVMRGMNDDELLDFIDFAAAGGVEVRFLELMAIGVMQSQQRERLVPAAEILTKLQEQGPLQRLNADHDSTSERYQHASGGVFGIIAPVTRSFCGTCSRWRLSAEGRLQACLMSEAGVDLKGASPEQIRMACRTVLNMKPQRGATHVSTPMHKIGG